MLDRSTRWCEVVPLKQILAETILDKFVENWVARFGVPTTVTADRGTQFAGGT